MGILKEGKWIDQWYDTKSNKGKFVRESAKFNNIIANPNVEKDPKYPAESQRYHLYVSYACPWAHRTLIMRKLKDLDKHISFSVVSTDMLENGWTFDKETGSTGDDLNNFTYLYEAYVKSVPDYTGRVTVPVLWDKKTSQIVNNESSEIIRIFNSAFNDITNNHNDYYPENLRGKIDEINKFVYDKINNGVYKAGFATTQDAYDEAYDELFAALDKVEAILEKNRYLVGKTFTEADIRLFTTLIRFDEVYFSHFKCNKKLIENYPNISAYRREIYQMPGVKETTNFYHIKRHYYFSHKMINPTQIVPKGPEIDYLRPFSEREKL